MGEQNEGYEFIPIFLVFGNVHRQRLTQARTKSFYKTIGLRVITRSIDLLNLKYFTNLCNDLTKKFSYPVSLLFMR